MGRRSKRLKCAVDPLVVSSREDGGKSVVKSARVPDVHEMQGPYIYEVHTGHYDSGSFSSRCSVRLIHEVVSKFDAHKRDLVKSIGFQGLLYFPDIKQFNRRFALWLMSSVNVETCSLNIDQHMSIRFNKHDVAHVFGLSASGKRVLDALLPCSDAKDFVLNQFLGPKFREQRSVKFVQEIIERDYAYPMSKSEEDIFKVAFVVFIVSNVLSPSAKHDYACIDYWNAIRDPDSIHTYDWSEYVIVRLLDAVKKLKFDISSNIKFPNISGCVLFLQVLYLDSIDLEGFVMDHKSFPRVRDFPFEKMRVMISADNNFLRHTRDGEELPTVKLRDPSDCIYSWALDHSLESEDSRSGSMLAIWETAVAMVHLLNIPLEAAGPVFIAVADFQEQINSGLCVTGTQALKIMTVLVSIMIPYRRGFSFVPSRTAVSDEPGSSVISSAISNGINLISVPIRSTSKKYCNTVITQFSKGLSEGDVSSVASCSYSFEGTLSPQQSFKMDQSHIGDHAQRSFNRVIASLDDVPHRLNVNLRVSSAMTQFYSVLRKMKSPRGFDLNKADLTEDDGRVRSMKHMERSIGALPSPFDLGYHWAGGAEYVTKFYEQLVRVEDDDSHVIIHRIPKYIQVSGGAIRAQLSGKCEMEQDLFDALIRVVRQEDDEMYAMFGDLRWRHFFESDLMEGIMSGSFDLLDSTIRDHLSLTSKLYDLHKCKILFFPALLHFRWVCFAWSLESNTIFVFEPSHPIPVPERRVVDIERACFLLKIAMQTLSGCALEGWSNQCTSADMCMLTLPSPGIQCYNRSGLLCSLFCRCFDGKELKCSDVGVDWDRVAVKLLCEVVKLKDNSGSFASKPPCVD